MHPDSENPPLGEHQRDFFLHGRAKAEMQVHCHFTELMLQSREIEDQTRVSRLDRRLPLWEALKEVTEGCFTRWTEAEGAPRDAFLRRVLAAKEKGAAEGQELVLAALRNPVQAKAVARILLLGHNFLRTLDICLEALLRYPSQKSVTRKPLKTEVVIDWAVGGIREWVCHYPYTFETAVKNRKAPQRMAHVTRHYSTDRSVRSQISHKQIANIFLLRENTVADIERRSLAKLRTAFKAGAGGDFDLSELADA